MFVGSLTLSSILITFGFQTASAIVMAVAGGTLPIKFYSCDRGKLTWAKRDVSTWLDCETVRTQPGLRTLGVIAANRTFKSYFPDCTLLSSTHRVFHVDGENIIHIGMPEGGNQDSGVGDNQNSAPGQLMYRPWDSMADLQALHLLKKDIQDSRGWVFFLPPDTHGEAGRIIETLDAIPAGINDIEMVGRETENPGYENQVPDEMLQISDDNSVWVHIKYTAIDNELGGPGSTDVEAIVGDKKAFFYSGPGGELKLLQKKSRVSDPHMNGFEQLN
jgi:hypothetical protein